MGSRVLIEAGAKHDLELMERVLSGDFGEVSTDCLNEALIRCATLGNVDGVSLLLAHGADIDAEDPDGDTPLMMASANNHTKLVKLFMELGADIDATSSRGRNALHMAVWNNRLMPVRMLLKAGIDTAVHDVYGDTSLMLCARRGYGVILKMLLRAGCDVEARSAERWTALQYAAQNDHVDCVRQLLHHGASIEAPNVWGYTPLFLSVMGGHTAAAHTLMEAGADISVLDRSQRSLLHYAAKRKRPDMLEHLVFRGLSPNVQDSAGRTPLLNAVELGLSATVCCLVRHNVDVDAIGRYSLQGRAMEWVTPVEMALCRGSLPVLRVLVMAGAHLQPLAARVSAGDIPDCLLGEEEFFEWVTAVLSEPRSLQDLCRLIVRRSMGLRVSFQLSRLPLPSSIHQYLAFHDLPQ